MACYTFSQRHAATSFILIICVLDVLALGIIVPVFPRIVEEFTASISNAGLLNGVFVSVWAGMQFFASPVLGALSDRFGRRPVLLISTAGLTIDYFLVALAPGLWWLFLARAFGGMTSASIGTVFAYMTDITEEEKRAKAFGLIGAAFSIGFIIGPVMGGLLGEISLRTPFWVAASLTGMAFLYGLFILPESLPATMRTEFSWKRANPFGAFRFLFEKKKLALLAMINLLVNFSAYVFHTVFVLYTAHRFGFTMFQFGLALALAAFLDAIVQAGLVGVCVKRFRNEGTLILGLIMGGFGTVLMALAPTAWLFILSLFPQALWGLATPTTQALMTTLISSKEQGQLQGANMSLVALAGIIAPIFFGGIYALFNNQLSFLNLPGAPFIFSGILLFIAAFLGIRIMK